MSHDAMTPTAPATARPMTGREAYEEDVRRRPTYDNGAPRRSWDQLDDIAQLSWTRNPTPRDYPARKPE